MTHLVGLPNNLVVCSCFHFSNGAWEWWYAGWWEKIEFWFLNQYIFKDAWMDGLLSKWFHRWVQTVASLLSNLTTLIPSNSLSCSWWSLEAATLRSSFSFFLYGSLLYSEKKTPFRSLQMAPFRFEKLFLLMLSKWHPSALKNFSYQCLQNGTFLLWKTILTDAFKIAPFYSEKLFLPVLSNKPSQALKTLLSRSLQTTPLMFSQLSLLIPSNNPSHALKTLSLSIPSNSPSHALKTLLFYPL